MVNFFMKKMKKNKKGFTLTELIVVIAILGILAAIATPAILSYLNDAKDSADIETAHQIENAIKSAVAKSDIKVSASGDVVNYTTPGDPITAFADVCKGPAAVTAIKDKLGGSFPTPSKTGKSFVLVFAGAKVSVVDTTAIVDTTEVEIK